MKRFIVLVFCATAITGCSWFGGSSEQHLSQKAQWEALGYKEGLKSAKQGM